jgi:hypothetical protein
MTTSAKGPRLFVMDLGMLRGDDEAATAPVCMCPDGTCLTAQNDNDMVVGDPVPVEVDPEYYTALEAFLRGLNTAGIDIAGDGEVDEDEDMFVVEREDDDVPPSGTAALMQLGRIIEYQSAATSLYAAMLANAIEG